MEQKKTLVGTANELLKEDTNKKNLEEKESRKQKLYKIASELLQTERAYVARLHLLDQVFCAGLTEEAAKGSFPVEVVRTIFSNISSIHSFHSQFLLPDLETRMSHWWETPRLGDVMQQHAPFLRMYAEYVSNFDQAMELLRQWTDRSAAFRNIILDIQSKDMCGSLTLQHHMLEPVQRVPRYEMLFKDYIGKLSEEDVDFTYAQKSLQTISMAAIHSNSAILKTEKLKKLLEIYEMLGDKEVVNPSNEFLKDGRLKLAARNTAATDKHLFLFNNMMFCCASRLSLVGQRFTVRTRIGIRGMQVQQMANVDQQHSFQVTGKGKTLDLQASSDQERDDWVKAIQEAIDVFRQNNETFKLANKSVDVDELTEYLGWQAPCWIRDNEVTMCMKCQEPFNPLTRRKQHCRACGCVVCSKCSDYKVALRYDGNKMNRVCRDCFFFFTGQDGGDVAETRKRVIQESEAVHITGPTVMCSFLQYGDNPETWTRMWCVIPRTEPLVLHLYSSPQR
ncbi:FYVE, RhoGEF and PH domain-containing protein 4 [Aplochiton taeniatus]